MLFSRTIIISCAGMGNRLGLGTTKALVEVEGKPLIVRQLELLDKEKDIRIVVGYQAEQVVEVVRKYRQDILFVFNHNYRKTGTGASVALASKYANPYILALDGDILIHPEDIEKVLTCRTEFVSGDMIKSEEPWMIQTYQDLSGEYVSEFSKEKGNYEWNGIAQMESYKMQKGTGHVFQQIEPYLPIPFLKVRTQEIDTIFDYEHAVQWVRNGFDKEKK